jgi:hypothetical protein
MTRTRRVSKNPEIQALIEGIVEKRSFQRLEQLDRARRWGEAFEKKGLPIIRKGKNDPKIQ